MSLLAPLHNRISLFIKTLRQRKTWATPRTLTLPVTSKENRNKKLNTPFCLETEM